MFRNFSHFVFVMALASTLISCGQKQSGKTLQVTTSLELGSAGFTGGLVVTGVKSDGTKFTATTTGGTSLVVPLVDGSWSIHVAGWDGAAPLQGTVHCGNTLVNLDSNTTSFSVTANEANCAGAVFNNGLANLSDTTYGFRQLQINTCAAMYYFDASNYYPITSSTAQSYFSGGFCTPSEVPKDFAKFAIAIKVIVEGDPNFPAISSSCISPVASMHNTGIRFPTNKIPVKVQLFKDGTCSGLPLEFKFNNGILAGSPQFDSVVNNQNTSATYNLFLPFNDVKKGYSALINKLPDFKCSGVSCLPQPASIPANYYLYYNGQYQEVFIPEVTSCSQLVATSTADLIIPASPGHCSSKNGSVYLKIKPNTGSSCSTGACTLALTLNASSVNRTFSAKSSYSLERSTYDSIWEVISNDGAPDFFFQFFGDDHDKSRGLIGHARSEVGPGGPLSLFGNVACTSLSGTETITFFDEGKYQTYQATAEVSTLAIPKLICDNGDGNAATCTNTTFDKKIILRQLVNQVWVAQEVFHLDCDNRIGMLENQEIQSDGTNKRTEKRLIGWNTMTAGNERIESLEYSKDENSANFTLQERSNFQRAEIFGSEFKVQAFDWDSQFNSTNNKYDERLNHRDSFTTGGELNSHSKNLSQNTSLTSGAIFDIPYFTQTFKIPYLARDSFQSRSPNGLKMVRVWSEVASGYSRVYASTFNGSAWTHPTGSGDFLSAAGSFDAKSPRVVINDSGDIILAWKEYVSTFWVLKMRRSIGGSWSSPVTISAGTYGGQVGDLDVCMENNMAAIVWDQIDTNITTSRIYVAYTTTHGVSNSWFNPSNANTESLSNGTYNTVKPKCAVESATTKIFVSYTRTASNQIHVSDAIATSGFSTAVSDLGTNSEQASPSGITPVESFIKRQSDKVIVSFYDTSLGKAYMSTYLLSGSSWVNPSSSTNGVVMQFSNDIFTKTMTNSFNALGAYAGSPSTALTIPSYNNLKTPSHFGLMELKPVYLNAIFTNYTTFKAQ